MADTMVYGLLKAGPSMRPSFLLLENAFLHLFIHFVEDARVVCGVQRTTCRKLFPSSTVWFSGISLKAPNGHPLPAKLSLAGPEVTSFLVFCCCALRCYILCLRLILAQWQCLSFLDVPMRTTLALLRRGPSGTMSHKISSLWKIISLQRHTLVSS